MKLPRVRRPVVAAAAAYGGLTIAYAWPLPQHILHGIAHDPWDPVLNTWILWWTTRAAPLTTHWWNAPIFFPAAGVFAFSEHLLGLAPLTAPIIWLTGNPVFAYNVALLAAFPLCAAGAHFLGYTLTRRHDAAFVAALAFAFAPYRLAQLSHVQVLFCCWTPVCLAALHRYDADSRWRWPALAAFAWLMQSLSNGYYFLFLTVLLALWLSWFGAGRWPLGRWIRLAACFVLPLVLLSAVLQGYHRILVDTYGFTRGIDEVRQFSADVGSLLSASEDLRVWGWLRVVNRPEGELFPGLAIVVLTLWAIIASRPLASPPPPTATRRWLRRGLATVGAVAAVTSLFTTYAGSWRLTIGHVQLLSVGRPDTALALTATCLLGWIVLTPRTAGAVRARSPLAFYLAAAFITWTFALGPQPLLFSHRIVTHGPYAWLMLLPGFDGLRVPSRFWMMTVACLSAVAALAIARAPARVRRYTAFAAGVAILLDGWPGPLIVFPEPPYHPAPPGVSARLDLPSSDDLDIAAMFQQMREGLPLYNGYSGYAAPHMYAMRTLLDRHDPRILEAMTARGSLGVVVDRRAPGAAALEAFVRAFPGAQIRESHEGWSSYVLPQTSPHERAADSAGEAIPITSLDAFPSAPHAARAVDGDLKTRWSGGVQQSTADFTVDVGRPQHVGRLVIDLGPFWTDFPERLRLSISPDGTNWRIVYEGDTALRAYDAAVWHPKAVPMVFPIDRDDVRFIRMQQVGWGTHDWSIAEVHVLR